jgi:hypothetical protein
MRIEGVLLYSLIFEALASFGLGITVECLEAHAFVAPDVALVGKISALKALFIRQCFDLLSQDNIYFAEFSESCLHSLRSHGCGHGLTPLGNQNLLKLAKER